MFTTPPRQFWGQLLQEMVLVSLEVQISRCSDYLHDKASLQASHTYMSEPVLKSESFIYVAEYILIIHNRSCIADKDITCEIVRSIRIRRSQRMTPPSKREGMDHLRKLLLVLHVGIPSSLLSFSFDGAAVCINPGKSRHKNRTQLCPKPPCLPSTVTDQRAVSSKPW